MAPPFTFTISSLMPRSAIEARPTTAKASLISNRSMSETCLLALTSACLMAWAGWSMSEGSGPATMP